VLLAYLGRVARVSAECALEPLGLRPRHLVVLSLLRDRGALAQGTLADALQLDPANVVGLLNELEVRGLLERRRDPEDRRRHIVELSARGHTTVAEGEDALESAQAEILAGLDEDEREALHALLSRAAEGRITSACAEAAGEPEVC
jgi:MarR family transcriptional regulator, lower aerobic nicotinate degradation pathway regulator